MALLRRCGMCAVFALFCGGCASGPSPEISFPALEVWDCRSDPPWRIHGTGASPQESDHDPLSLRFADLTLPDEKALGIPAEPERE